MKKFIVGILTIVFLGILYVLSIPLTPLAMAWMLAKENSSVIKKQLIKFNQTLKLEK